MAELKRKITLKQKTPIENKKPIKKNKFLLPILVILLLAILIGGYCLLRDTPTTETRVVDNENPTTEIPKITSENGITAQPPDSVVPTTKVNDTPIEPAEKSELPYQPNVTYKVYQFSFGAANYSQANPELDKLVKVLSGNNPSVKIKIFAYTGQIGSSAFNQVLSEKRAKAIYDFLVSKGIEKSRLSYQGKGISTKYANDAENRRAEFVLAE
jgi:outer membrane protein OmpA-like peptidoglycan-associated protein